MQMGRLWILALFSLTGAFAVTRTAIQWEEEFWLGEEESGFGEGTSPRFSQILVVFLSVVFLMAATIGGQ